MFITKLAAPRLAALFSVAIITLFFQVGYAAAPASKTQVEGRVSMASILSLEEMFNHYINILKGELNKFEAQEISHYELLDSVALICKEVEKINSELRQKSNVCVNIDSKRKAAIEESYSERQKIVSDMKKMLNLSTEIQA